jgi:hypothetical protein
MQLLMLIGALAGGEAVASSSETASSSSSGIGQQAGSIKVRQFADWIVETNDNQSMPFVIVDKATAEAVVFYADGRTRGVAPVLLGMAIGDDSVPGIGKRKLSTIRPDERTTPAGRFVASRDRNMHGEEIVWVDYDAAISMHRVITSNPKERRLQRLAAAEPLEHRISYGCINVPAKFYEKVVSPSFAKTSGVVYVLPETRDIAEVFPAFVNAQRDRHGKGLVDSVLPPKP